MVGRRAKQGILWIKGSFGQRIHKLLEHPTSVNARFFRAQVTDKGHLDTAAEAMS